MHSDIITDDIDIFQNPNGHDFDLGRDGAFTEFSIIVGLFCPHLNENRFRQYAAPSIEKKGFQLKCTMDEEEFLENLFEYDVAWIISDEKEPTNPEFSEKIIQYNKLGHGVCFWTDNSPWFATVNPIIKTLFNVIVFF